MDECKPLNRGRLILVKSEHLANPTSARDAVRAKLGKAVQVETSRTPC